MCDSYWELTKTFNTRLSRGKFFTSFFFCEQNQKKIFMKFTVPKTTESKSKRELIFFIYTDIADLIFMSTMSIDSNNCNKRVDGKSASVLGGPLRPARLCCVMPGWNRVLFTDCFQQYYLDVFLLIIIETLRQISNNTFKRAASYLWNEWTDRKGD